MPGPEFFQTVMGKRFYEGTMPALVRATERLAQAVEASNEVKAKELAALEAGAALKLRSTVALEKIQEALFDWRKSSHV